MGESTNQQHYLRASIGGFDLHFANVLEVVVREWMFDVLPTCVMHFQGGQEWTKGLSLQEQQEIKLEFGSAPTEVKPAAVNSTFVSRAWQISKGQERMNISVSGNLAVSNFGIPAQFRSIPGKTSSEVLAQIGKELSLKVTETPAPSSDQQTWLQCGQTNHRFIQDVLGRSWVGVGDALFAWADRTRKWDIQTLTSIVARAKEPKKLVSWPEGVIDDQDPMEMDKESRVWPIAGFEVMDHSGILNLMRGYGTAIYRFNATDFELSFLKPNDEDVLAGYRTMDKDAAGKAVEVRYSEQPPSVHPEWYRASVNRKRVVDATTGTWAVVQMRPHPLLQVGELVDLKLGELAQGQTDRQPTPYDGLWIIGGLVHHHQRDFGTKTMVVLFRGGHQAGIAETGEQIRSLKNTKGGR